MSTEALLLNRRKHKSRKELFVSWRQYWFITTWQHLMRCGREMLKFYLNMQEDDGFLNHFLCLLVTPNSQLFKLVRTVIYHHLLTEPPRRPEDPADLERCVDSLALLIFTFLSPSLHSGVTPELWLPLPFKTFFKERKKGRQVTAVFLTF